MSVGTSSSDGVLYSYTTKLPVGIHSYSFTFSDTVGTVTLPFNGVYLGPEVHAFNLTNRLNVINFAGLLSGTAVGPRRSSAIRVTTAF